MVKLPDSSRTLPLGTERRSLTITSSDAITFRSPPETVAAPIVTSPAGAPVGVCNAPPAMKWRLKDSSPAE